MLLTHAMQTVPLILGSGSPRRKQLLADTGLKFSVLTKNTNEDWPADLPTDEIAAYLANKKATAFKAEAQQSIILTADTVVCVGDKVLNKAETHHQALEMLRLLAGKTHQTYTGICIRYQDQVINATAVADVTFADMPDEVLNHYINTSKPFDKAGAYGIQDWISLVGITEIKGSYYTVMGLPTHLVYAELYRLYASLQ